MLIDETYEEKNVLIGHEIWDEIEKRGLDKRSPTVLSDEERKGFLIIPPIEDQPMMNQSLNDLSIRRGSDIFNHNPKPVEWVIKDLIPKRKKTLSVGDYEAGKSFINMGAALSIATGQSKYLGFEIPKQLRVLYVDLENGEDETYRRIESLAKGFGISPSQTDGYLSVITKPGDFSDRFTLITAETEMFNPEVIFIDNLYQLSGYSDISDNNKIKSLLADVETLRSNNDTAIVMIHHFKKNTEEQGLEEGRMLGASSLLFWMEHCTLLGKTNQGFTILGMGKSRVGKANSGLYSIEINDVDDDGIVIEKKGLISPEKVKGLLLPERKKLKWDAPLDRCPDTFDTKDWVNICTDKMNPSVSDRTAKTWLKEMVSVGMIKKLNRGLYKKTGIEIYGEG
ncbi:AAA family ATPase [Candidatus Marinimicrobia bacterium]|nr:AAA family ATPase [Candidatus Neomarinimicrobiota bacterium]